jgi:CRP-like cAMP-binding protein
MEKTDGRQQLYEPYLKVITQSDLFDQIDAEQVPALLSCLDVRIRQCLEGEDALLAGQEVKSVGMLLVGSAHIIQEDYWGNRLLVAQLLPGDLFSEAISCANLEQSPVSVLATEDIDFLFLDLQRVVRVCSNTCNFHSQLIQNLLQVLAHKSIQLMGKLEDVSRRSTRAKLLSYLSKQALSARASRFEIPFNRQELADYLAVDRSALSAELSRMQKAELLRYHQNRFELL